MRFKLFIIFSIVAASLAAGGVTATAENRKDREAATEAENRKLKQELDSLKAVAAQYRQALDEAREKLARLEIQSSDPYTVFNLGPDAKDSISLWDALASAEDICADENVPDSVKLSSDVSDDVYLRRIRQMNNIFTLPYNDIVRNYVVSYAEKRKSSMPTVLGLCSYYFPIFQETFNRFGLPEELACMAIIESMMNPRALSRAGARGMWQFMYNTGKKYGLTIDSYVDERLDIEKAADAAARYLLDAYRRFGDWSLAISSYNCGPGNVLKAIARAGDKREFWDIYPYLPRETRGYVPAFVGALYITKFYREHGISPKPAALPEQVDTFHINKRLHFRQISELVGIPQEELENLNPQFIHDIVPGNNREYVLKIPARYSRDFIACQDTMHLYLADTLFSPVVIKKIEDGVMGSGSRVSYKVRSGDSLGKIASKFHVSVASIKKWNGLRSDMIHPGQTLYLYGRSSSTSKSTATSTSKSAASYSGTQATYTVSAGDTMWSISQKYPGITADDIMAYNKCGTSLHVGQVLKIPKK